jgi:hypothetical protein
MGALHYGVLVNFDPGFYFLKQDYDQGCFCPTCANESRTRLSRHGCDPSTGNLRRQTIVWYQCS